MCHRPREADLEPEAAVSVQRPPFGPGQAKSLSVPRTEPTTNVDVEKSEAEKAL